MAKRIPCNKVRPLDNPYEVWENKDAEWEWRVLKKYQKDDDAPFARVLVAARTPYTHGNWEYGDEYYKTLKESGQLTETNYGNEYEG